MLLRAGASISASRQCCLAALTARPYKFVVNLQGKLHSCRAIVNTVCEDGSAGFPPMLLLQTAMETAVDTHGVAARADLLNHCMSCTRQEGNQRQLPACSFSHSLQLIFLLFQVAGHLAAISKCGHTCKYTQTAKLVSIVVQVSGCSQIQDNLGHLRDFRILLTGNDEA